MKRLVQAVSLIAVISAIQAAALTKDVAGLLGMLLISAAVVMYMAVLPWLAAKQEDA